MGANATSFKKGFDSRRCIPQNAGIWEFRQKLGGMLRDKSLDAFDYLIDTMNNEALNPKLRKECAIEILNRGLGVPVSTIHIEHSESNNSFTDAKKLTTSELESMIATLSPVKVDDVIEGEVVETPKCTELDVKNSLKQSGVKLINTPYLCELMNK